jgi:hypothetical protein
MIGISMAFRSARRVMLAICGLTFASIMPAAHAANGYLEAIHRHSLLASTVTTNGDLNPYAVVVAPVTVGKIQQGDVLVTNFNNVSNLQGTGTTIVDYHPATHQTTLFASLPQHLSQCPGGIGLSTAMAVLRSGWVIVGSTPSTDGTTSTKGPGCLLVLDADGQLKTAWTGPNIDDPWGNMAVIDNGTSATLFISMAGFDVPAPGVTDPKTGDAVIVNKATVLRLDLSIPAGGPPTIASQTVVANGFGQRADRDAFLIGPTGLALAADGTLYVSDALGNRIAAIDNATTRATSAGTGRTIAANGLLKRPLAMCFDPDGNLLVTNAKNGQVVEVDPKSGHQLLAQWIDADQAQSPPGNGDLFGLAVKPDGSGFYYVEDDVNTLMEASR